MIPQEQEDVMCFFCHQTSFQFDDLRVYRLCQCSPTSPLICTYCCFSKEKLYCSECGLLFNKQALMQKATYLKNLEVKQKKSSLFNQQARFNGGNQFFRQPMINQMDSSYQQFENQPQMLFTPQQQDYGNNFIKQVYEQQFQQDQRSRISFQMAQTTPHLGQSLAQSQFVSPVKFINQTISDESVFEAYNISQTASTKEADSNRQDKLNSYLNSQESNWSKQNKINSSIFSSVSSRCDLLSSNFDQIDQQNTINQPWNTNQQRNQMHNQPNRINQFQQQNNLFSQNGSNQKVQPFQQNNIIFPNNIQSQQQQIFNNLMNSQSQIKQNSQQQSELKQQQNTNIQTNNVFPDFQQQQQNFQPTNFQEQQQQQQFFSQQSTLIDENTLDRFNNIQFFEQETLQNNPDKDMSINSLQNSSHFKYIQNVAQPQRIITHLHQSLDPSVLNSSSRRQSLNSSISSFNNLNSSGFGQTAEFLQQKGTNAQKLNRSKSVQMSQSLSLNDLADKSLNKSFKLEEPQSQKSENKEEKRCRNKDFANYFRTSRSTSKDPSILQSQSNSKLEKQNNVELSQFQKEQEQMIYGKNFFQQNLHQQQINNQNYLNQIKQNNTFPNTQTSLFFGNNSQQNQLNSVQQSQLFNNQNNNLNQRQTYQQQTIKEGNIIQPPQAQYQNQRAYQMQSNQTFNPNQNKINSQSNLYNQNIQFYGQNQPVPLQQYQQYYSYQQPNQNTSTNQMFNNTQMEEM